jgi:hypothetical protein
MSIPEPHPSALRGQLGDLTDHHTPPLQTHCAAHPTPHSPQASLRAQHDHYHSSLLGSAEFLTLAEEKLLHYPYLSRYATHLEANYPASLDATSRKIAEIDP